MTYLFVLLKNAKDFSLKPENQKYSFHELVEIMSRLRDPDTGCPWDLQQDFKTIAPYTLEEAYEVADAIDRNDMTDLCEELGDLLLQPVYHAQMAFEASYFSIDDVVDSVARKMVERHPHVFGDARAESPEDVNAIWDEKKLKSQKKPNGKKASALDGVTQSLPALLKAQKLQSKAAKVGFEWPKIENVLDKLEEELCELRDACRSGTLEQKMDEIGDVFFVLVNLARMLGINSEEALRQCNNKFERRFRGLESELTAQGQKLTEITLKDMTEAWNRQKEEEKIYFKTDA